MRDHELQVCELASPGSRNQMNLYPIHAYIYFYMPSKVSLMVLFNNNNNIIIGIYIAPFPFIKCSKAQ